MKKILLSLLFCSTAFAELPSIRNDSCAAVLNGTNGLPGYMCVDSTGKLSMSIPASATSIAKAEDSVHSTGETGAFALGVANETGLTLAADGDYTGMAVNTKGAMLVNIDNSLQRSSGSGLLKLEDAASASGEAGVAALGVVNTAGTVLAAAGDYTTPALTTNGAMQINQDLNFVTSTATNILKQEDATAASGDVGVAMLGQRLDQLATGQTGGNNEYAVPIVDTLSRQYVNAWGAAVTEFFQSCGTATATTADVAIKAAVASNRHYITSFTCKNTSATTATSLDFKDGSTVIAVGGISQMATTAPGSFNVSFGVPLRGTSNTAINFATNISVSSVTCCANGFISPY